MTRHRSPAGSGDGSQAYQWLVSEYDSSTGWLLSRCSGLVTCSGVSQLSQTNVDAAATMKLGYTMDAFGNLKSSVNIGKRPSGVVNDVRSETFNYDKLHRMISAQRNGQTAVTYSYTAVGNLLSKSDFGSNYQYTDAAHKHGVKQVTLTAGGTKHYGYDANGNVIARGNNNSLTEAFGFDIDNRPQYTLTNGTGTDARTNTRIDFYLSATGAKALQIAAGQQTRTVIYAGSYEAEYTGSTLTASRTYLAEGVLHNGAGTQIGLSFMHQDRLGSALVITDKSGVILNSDGSQAEFRSFDAFGKARDNQGLDSQNGKLFANNPNGKRNRKGFTGHEHLDEAGLIHMNGRAYDYNLGRFYGVDPIIQFPTNSQSLNGYSYLMNNPLSGTDPTGYECQKMTGSGVCGVDTGAKNGVASVTVKTYGKDGKVNGTATKVIQNGQTSYKDFKLRDSGASAGQTSTGESRNQGNSGRTEADEITDSRARVTNAGKTVSDGAKDVGNVISPCSMDSKHCAAETAVSALLGAIAGKILAKELRVADLDPSKWLDRKVIEGNLERELHAVRQINLANGCGGASCFVAGTPVMTPEGLKAIELIQVGELVQARNELTGETKWQRVEEIIISHDREVWDYTFADDGGTVETIGATPVHPFHSPSGEWIEVGKLGIGQQVSSLDGRVLVLQSKAIRETGETTYNFEIAEDHNYFVGTIGAWVHNGAGNCVACPPLGKAAVEELTRLRLQTRLGTNIYSSASQNAPDFFDGAGRTFDQMGNPAMAPFWEKQRDQFFSQIQDHLRKADFTVIDLTGLPSNIRSDVGEHVLNLPQSQFDKIIPIGF